MINNNDNKGNQGEEDHFCSVTNPATGQFIDLSQLSTTPNVPSTHKKNPNSKKEITNKARWLVKGYGWDIEKNFTISICSSPITEDQEYKTLSNSTGAYYSFNNTKENEVETVSIGDFSTTPRLFSNKKLTLQYDNGSLCPNGKDHRSTLLNFVCDRDITSRAHINYIGNTNNCSYFFEVRSIYACPTANKTNEVNVLGIFFGILLVFTLVEFCRRWIKRQIDGHSEVSRQTPSSIITRNRNDQQAIDNYYRYSTNDPHWEFLEERSIISKWFHKARDMLRGRVSIFGGNGDINQRYNPYNGSIRLDPSNSTRQSANSFFRDMETQNDILDQLDDLNDSQGDSVRSSVYSNVSPTQ